MLAVLAPVSKFRLPIIIKVVLVLVKIMEDLVSVKIMEVVLDPDLKWDNQLNNHLLA